MHPNGYGGREWKNEAQLYRLNLSRDDLVFWSIIAVSYDNTELEYLQLLSSLAI